MVIHFNSKENSLLLKTGILTALFFVFMGCTITYLSHQNTIKSWQNELDSLTLVNSEHASQILQNSNRVLENLLDVLVISKIDNELKYVQFASDPKQFDLLKEKTLSNSIIDVATFVDAEGNVINFSRSYPPPKINLADRDYFIYLKNNNDLNVFYSAPVQNRGTGNWVFYQAQRINGKNNQFLGIALVGISSKVFSEYYEVLANNFNSKVAFGLYKSDHKLMTRYPFRENLIGKANLEGGAKKILDLDKPFGNMILKTPRFTENERVEERFVGVRRLEKFPFYVTVTANKDIYLKSWMESLWWIWGLTISGVILVVFAVTRIYKVQKSLTQELGIKKEFEKELFKSKEELEIRVKDRTNALTNEILERKLAQQELLRINSNIALISHRAGKLEVVNSMLHNVGNVLNSLNISTDLLRERLSDTPIKNLPKLNELFLENKANLSEFLINNEKGKQIPEFINQMTLEWQKNNDIIYRETHNVVESIQHINEIISRYKLKDFEEPGELGVQESYMLNEVIDSTLLIASPGLFKTNIQLALDYEPNITWVGDRVKLSQIILNLVINAKDALLFSEKIDKKIMIHSEIIDDQIIIKVRDNGSGIDQELLDKIFTYGFTTKPTGHGYGLHSGALAAQEMGGKLQVHSLGVNLGAEFTLTLPKNISKTK
jgi:signal transduction histidine kinase